jgi:hypothetical protein
MEISQNHICDDRRIVSAEVGGPRRAKNTLENSPSWVAHDGSRFSPSFRDAIHSLGRADGH